MESQKAKWVIFFFVLTLITVTVSPDSIWAEISKGDEISCRPRPRSLYGYPGDYGFAGTPLVGSGYYDKPWVVYADREGAPVFRDEACRNQTGMKLRFLEPLFVVGVRKDKGALELVRARWPWAKLDIEVNDYIGWVKVDDLLLLMNALQHERTLIFKKCFVVNDWRKFVPGSEQVTFEDVEAGNIKLKLEPVVVRNGPGKDYDEVTTLSAITLFSFAFKSVEVEGEKWSLIGKQKNIIPGNEKDYLLGWIKGDRVAEWDTREALEPNPSRTGPAHIYETAPDLRNKKEPLLLDNMGKEVWPPERWRYVIMSKGNVANTEYARIGWTGALLSDEGVFQAPEAGDPIAAAAGFRKWVMGFWNSQQTVNIIFVIDASKSMFPYLDKAAAIAETVMSKHKGKVKFGAVVYRDVSDGPECTNKKFLTRDAGAVSLFLRGEKKLNLPDTDFPEALYRGLKTALGNVAKSGENNVIILIGDAGNNFGKDSTTAAEIAALAHEKYAQIHAVRITRSQGSAAEVAAMARFRPDVKKVSDDLTQRNRSEVGQLGQYPSVTWTSYTEAPHQQTAQKAGDAVLGSIDDAFREQRVMLDELVARIETGSAPQGGWATHAPSAKLLQLMKRYFEAETGDATLADRIIRFLNSNTKVQIFQPGFVRLLDETGAPLMRKVTLLSMEDLANLTRVLDEFTSTLDKKDLIRVWKEAIIASLGTIPDSPEQYVQMRTGLVLKGLNSFLSKSWSQLREVTDDELMDFVKKANKIKEALRDLMNSPEYFRNYDIQYAWVSAKKMP